VTGVPWLDAAIAQAPLVAAVYALLDARMRRVESTLARIETSCARNGNGGADGTAPR
jgi:hypothetical protein